MGDQTQETDDCRPSLKYNQVVKDISKKIPEPIIKYFSIS